jgi:Tfp pilus assembly protein PilX
MILVRLGALVAVGVVAVASLSSAQSLADIARQEEARRASIKKAEKAYANADLHPVEVTPLSSGVPAEACYRSISLDRCVTADELIAKSNGKLMAEKASQEPSWRQKAETIRGQVRKARQEIDAFSDTALSENRSPGERAVAARMLAQRQATVKDLERRWEQLEKDAENFTVPPAWLDPRPPFAPNTPQ